MWMRTIASKVLRSFAQKRRTVIGDWRVLLTCRRLAAAENAPLPERKKGDAVVRFLVKHGDLAAIAPAIGVYRIQVPFADTIPVSDEQILQEANPWAVFSHLTALAQHGLTDLIPDALYATHYAEAQHRRLLERRGG